MPGVNHPASLIASMERSAVIYQEEAADAARIARGAFNSGSLGAAADWQEEAAIITCKAMTYLLQAQEWKRGRDAVLETLREAGLA